MTKRHFIALADAIKEHKEQRDMRTGNARREWDACEFDQMVTLLADFCQSQNPRFNRSRWLSYIAGECGPNGGTVQVCK